MELGRYVLGRYTHTCACEEGPGLLSMEGPALPAQAALPQGPLKVPPLAPSSATHLSWS